MFALPILLLGMASAGDPAPLGTPTPKVTAEKIAAAAPQPDAASQKLAVPSPTVRSTAPDSRTTRLDRLESERKRDH